MKKGQFFMEKWHQKFIAPPPINPFLGVLYQNKALYSFCKKGQHSTVERKIGLEYALLAKPIIHSHSTRFDDPDTANECNSDQGRI